jgi:hypothetical protein
MNHGTTAERLLTSPEPSVRLKVRVDVLGEDAGSRAIRRLREEVRNSPRVFALLAGRDAEGRIGGAHVYRKWTGAHWVMAALADLGYPAGDKALVPLRDQVFDCWLHPKDIEEHVCRADDTPRWRPHRGVPIINGRARRCASQQGNALWSALALGLMDDRCRQLAALLMRWQWPDGGWNCDTRPDAATSSFWESRLPLRALALYAQTTGSVEARRSAERAAEAFLSRKLFRRRRDGRVMNAQFLRLHYPCYWRYDILCGLRTMAEAGFIQDPRCAEALDLLESKRLPDGGWPAEERFYRTSNPAGSGMDVVDWGGVHKKRMNEWVTVHALAVLKAAGRLRV